MRRQMRPTCAPTSLLLYRSRFAIGFAWVACALTAAVAPAGDGAATATPPHEVVIVGRSVEGTPIEMEVFGDGAERVLVLGGMHGNEPSGAALARELAAFLRSHPKELRGRTVAIIAEVNPDGLRRGWRSNSRDVDLNRNFPSKDWRPAGAGSVRHGPRPASEPETLAVMRAVEQIKPRRIVDIHSISGHRQCNNFDGPGERLAELMSACNDYPVEPSIGYATPGCLGSWTGIDDHIPTITLELPRGESASHCWRENAGALLAFVDGQRRRDVRGRIGAVADGSGKSIAATPPVEAFGPPLK